VRLDHAMQIVSLLATAVLSSVSVDRYTRDPPRVDRVEPDVAKPNEIVTAFGSNLGRTYVVDLILRSPDSDALAHIVEQRDDRIRFRIPQFPAASRYSIVLVLADRWEPQLVDQQVFITILTEEA